jgi:predicted DNA-binding transcriptional regulator AlpA
MKAVAVADLLGLSIKTIYDWRYKQKTRNIPSDLFIKVNRLLFVRTAVLRKWITSQNQYLI